MSLWERSWSYKREVEIIRKREVRHLKFTFFVMLITCFKSLSQSVLRDIYMHHISLMWCLFNRDFVWHVKHNANSIMHNKNVSNAHDIISAAKSRYQRNYSLCKFIVHIKLSVNNYTEYHWYLWDWNDVVALLWQDRNWYLR